MTTPTGRARVPGSSSYATGRAVLGEDRPRDFDMPGGPGGNGPRPPVPGGPPRRRPRPRWGRIALVAAVALVLLLGGGGFAAYLYANHLDDPAEDGLEPVLSWQSFLAHVKPLQPGESTGYGRSFVAAEPTWIGIVPIGYGDGFRRDLSGTEVRVGGELREVVGTVSMDSLAVLLDRELPVGTPVVLLGHGVLAESHARVSGTINYELTCGVETGPLRARRTVIDG